MGKPSQTHVTSKSKISSSNSRMNFSKNAIKLENSQRKFHQNTKKKIKKLFDKIRNESNSSCEINNTVIEIDNDTPLKRKTSNSTQIYRKAKIRRTNSENHSIVICDDDELITNSQPCNPGTPRKNLLPMHCSTPIINQNSETPSPSISSSSKNPNNNSLSHNLNNDIKNLTKEINQDSFLTIDLTTETIKNSSLQNTVIDLANTSDQDCLFVSASNASLSGESDVTVLNSPGRSGDKHLNRFVKGLSRLNSNDKGKLLELITTRILSGCDVPKRVKSNLRNLGGTTSQATDTVEDTYIKEVILGQTMSRNSIGSNIYNPEKDIKNKSGLRMIVIDGSNVAMEHGRGKFFSVKGLKICIDYFINRGHIVKAFVPRFRCKMGKSSEPRLLDELERRGLVVYTPSREIQGKTITPYDDRYIVQCAAEFDGVIVSGDNYRDLHRENPRWRFIIENRLLPFTWVNDMIMFPKDPLGRNGPSLEQFLKHGNHIKPTL